MRDDYKLRLAAQNFRDNLDLAVLIIIFYLPQYQLDIQKVENLIAVPAHNTRPIHHHFNLNYNMNSPTEIVQ